MHRSVMCRVGLHRWDRIRDERAREFLTCRRCGSDRAGARGRVALARGGRARAMVLLSTSLVLAGALMVSWLVVGGR